MIQVDVFWSFAFGASFAALVPEGIKRSKSMFVNKYFVFTICYLSMIFAPSGIYLLWQHCAWETMFYLDRSMHGIWPCIFANTNVSLGVLGFMACYQLIKSGHQDLTHPVWVLAYTCMFAILTFGYDRFLYAGTQEEWQAGVKYQITDFFSCDVFHALMVMSVFVGPPLVYPMTLWPSQYGMTSQQKRALIHNVLLTFLWISGLFVTAFCVAYFAGLLPSNWGYDRLVAFTVGQLVFGSLVMAPIAAIPRKPPKDA